MDGIWRDGEYVLISSLEAQIVGLRKQVENLRKDAERYRTLRRGQHYSIINGIGDVLRGDALDTKVDAVIEVGSSDTAPKD